MKAPLKIDKKHPIVTAKVGKNSDQFPDILALYVEPGSVIADVTYNTGRFWKGIPNLWAYMVLASDIDDVVMDKQRGFWSKNIRLKANFTALPYRDECLDAVILDPPYGQGGSSSPRRDDIRKSYNLKPREEHVHVLSLYSLGCREALRVLKSGGIAIIKCQDYTEERKQWWMHCDIRELFLATNAFIAVDLFILIQENTPIMRHDVQYHARKNHSYWWVFRKTRKNDL